MHVLLLSLFVLTPKAIRYNMSSLVFAVSLNGSNPHWIDLFSTVPMKIKSDVIELKILNMWCGEGKHPIIKVKL